MNSRLHLKLELDELKLSFTEEELNNRFFKNFGCINFQAADDNEFYHELGLARLWHEEQMKLHPDLHKFEFTQPHYHYRVAQCKYGYREEYNTSD